MIWGVPRDGQTGRPAQAGPGSVKSGPLDTVIKPGQTD
jgi:hypothetical protein